VKLLPAPEARPTSPGPADGGSRIAGLDGLRAIAAISIIVHHSGFASGATFNEPWKPFLGRMDVGVPIFFVLSGFLLYRPFVARFFDDRKPPDALVFWLRRGLRIFPAYWVALYTMLIIGGIAVLDWRGLFINGTLTHIYFVRRGITGITQSWSLATEICFYFLLPFWHLATSRLLRRRSIDDRATGLLIGIGLVYLSSILFRTIIAVRDPSFRPITPQWFFSQSDIFALGMALAVVREWAKHNTRVADLARRLSRPVTAWFVGAVFLFWFGATQFELKVGLDVASANREAIRQFLYGLIGFCLVLPFALGDRDAARTRIGRLLETRVMIYLGTISYGIYLWHQYVIKRMQIGLDWRDFEGHFWGLFFGALVGSVVIASISHKVIEEPLLRLGHRVRSR
jgi:peptidoglycan/LPS O-acetylase OafA/YrhL